VKYAFLYGPRNLPPDKISDSAVALRPPEICRVTQGNRYIFPPPAEITAPKWSNYRGSLSGFPTAIKLNKILNKSFRKYASLSVCQLADPQTFLIAPEDRVLIEGRAPSCHTHRTDQHPILIHPIKVSSASGPTLIEIGGWQWTTDNCRWLDTIQLRRQSVTQICFGNSHNPNRFDPPL